MIDVLYPPHNLATGKALKKTSLLFLTYKIEIIIIPTS